MAVTTQAPFGKTSAGNPVALYTLRNQNGMEVKISTYGGAIVSCTVPDRSGNPTDVVLGYDRVEDYEKQQTYLGSLIGRHGNRIEKGRFTLNGKTYNLFCNDGNNHLHGGKIGFDKKIWHAERLDGGRVALSLLSPDGEEGYPGNLYVTVTYSLDNNNALRLDYEAHSDADTICNLTNHTYFNLNGHNSGTILNQEIRLNADFYTHANAESLPDGRIEPVDGTPMDLRELTPIGKNIDSDFDQLKEPGGYDSNWVVRGTRGVLREAAFARSKESGITLTALTSLPGIQFYSGNYLDGTAPGKNGASYTNRCGFCLETQFFPNALAHPEFEQPILRKGTIFHSITEYRFGTEA